MITTVLGDVAPAQIGFCQFHEHILLSKGPSFDVSPALFFDDEEKSLLEVLDFKHAGGGALVDAQPMGCNRMTQGIVSIAKRSNLPIICSTGFHKMIFYPENHWIFELNEEELSQFFLHELTQGMYIDSDKNLPQMSIPNKAGLMKAAIDRVGLTPQYRKLFGAAAKICALTKCPLMIHVESQSEVLTLFDFLIKEGVMPSQMVYCHLDRSCQDLSIHKELCKRGAFLEYDTIARWKYHDNNRELSIFTELLNAGYEDHLLFSLDTTRERLKHYGGNIGLTYLLEEFVPLMKAAGITADQIDKISHKNCVRVLDSKQM